MSTPVPGFQSFSVFLHLFFALIKLIASSIMINSLTLCPSWGVFLSSRLSARPSAAPPPVTCAAAASSSAYTRAVLQIIKKINEMLFQHFNSSIQEIILNS